MGKRSAFFYFMVEKRDAMIAADSTFKGSLKDVAQLVGAEWEKMATDEREKYVQKADAVNLNNGGKKKPQQREKSPKGPEAQRQKVSEVLAKFPREMSFPIVLAHFNTFWDATDEVGPRAIPSEIGLVAFSMEKGIYDNYATLVDPAYMPPTEYAPHYIDPIVKANRLKQKIMEPGSMREFQNYGGILKDIEHFWKKNSEQPAETKMIFFCIESEIETTKACFSWIYRRAFHKENVQILSLESLALVMSNKAYANRDDRFYRSAYVAETYKRKESIVKHLVPVAPHYPHILSDGIFHDEGQVTSFLKQATYETYPEFACLYHMEMGESCRYCPLAMSNKYAYLLLGVMLRNFRAMPKPGAHYPLVGSWSTEALNRKILLYRWTSVEYKTYVEAYRQSIKDEEVKKLKTSIMGLRSLLRETDEPNTSAQNFFQERTRRISMPNPITGEAHGFYSRSCQDLVQKWF